MKYSTIEQIICFLKIEINNLKIELDTITKIHDAYQDYFLIDQEIDYYNRIIDLNNKYKINKGINFNKKMKKPIKI